MKTKFAIVFATITVLIAISAPTYGQQNIGKPIRFVIIPDVYEGAWWDWFDGTARSLSAHVTSADKASLFLEVADDVDGLVSVAKKMTAAAEDLASNDLRNYYLSMAWLHKPY